MGSLICGSLDVPGFPGGYSRNYYSLGGLVAFGRESRPSGERACVGLDKSIADPPHTNYHRAPLCTKRMLQRAWTSHPALVYHGTPTTRRNAARGAADLTEAAPTVEDNPDPVTSQVPTSANGA